MKAFTISAAIAMLFAQAHASPMAAKAEARQFEAQITFQGAPPYVHFEVFPSPSAQFSEFWIMFLEQMEGLRSWNGSQPRRQFLN